MYPIRCLIVEDEPLAQEIIENYIKRLPFLKLVGMCENALKAYDTLMQTDVDLIFCDIQMPIISGLEFIKSLSKRPAIIFTTAYHQHAVDAFDLDAVDYLMKPISFNRFLRAVQKVKERLESPKPNTTPTVAYPQQTTGFNDSFQHIFVKEDGKLTKINLSDILYVEGMKDYVKIHFQNRFIVTHLTMKKIDDSLSNKDFLRVHKSYIVQLKAIKSINGNMIELGDKQQIPIGLQYREMVMTQLRVFGTFY